MNLNPSIYNFSSKIYNTMNYWDIDSFLAEQQKFTCYFTKQAHGLQFLDPTKGHDGNIQANEQIQAPIWVLNVLNDYLPRIEEQKYFKVKFPGYLHSKEFKNRVESFITQTRNSSLQKVNLERQSGYLYETHLLSTKMLLHQQVQYDQKLISNLLRIRGKYILIRASTYLGNKNIDATLNTYTNFETRIYKMTKKIVDDCNAWKHNHYWSDRQSSLNQQ